MSFLISQWLALTNIQRAVLPITSGQSFNFLPLLLQSVSSVCINGISLNGAQLAPIASSYCPLPILFTIPAILFVRQFQGEYYIAILYCQRLILHKPPAVFLLIFETAFRKSFPEIFLSYFHQSSFEEMCSFGFSLTSLSLLSFMLSQQDFLRSSIRSSVGHITCPVDLT